VRWFLGALVSVTVVGCFAKLAAEPGLDGGPPGEVDGGVDAAAVDSSVPPDVLVLVQEPDGNVEFPDGQELAPLPVCAGMPSECILTGHSYEGVAEITCAGAYFVGGWTLLLERENINGQFELIQTQTTNTPGFGETFYDNTAPLVDSLTYRVCVQDSAGTRCAAPFMTEAPPDCACEGYTCVSTSACNTKIYDGCGGYITCGACPSGIACNPANNSCCPTGFQGRLGGGCECAPPTPCHGTWNPGTCQCDYDGP
jgi:hypothetical protein